MRSMQEEKEAYDAGFRDVHLESALDLPNDDDNPEVLRVLLESLGKHPRVSSVSTRLVDRQYDQMVHIDFTFRIPG